MNRLGKLSTAVLIMVLIFTASLDAQGPRRDGPRGRFGGRRMMSPLVLLASVPEVQKELHIDARQQQLLEALVADLGDQQRGLFRGGFDEPREPDDGNSRFERTRSRWQELNRQSERLILAVFEPKQAERLIQLRLQFEGMRALDRAEFLEAIGLTDAQKEQIRQMRDRESADREAARDQAPSGGDVLEADVMAVLTDEQKAKWEQMKGEPFAFPEEFPRFGRRGFRGRPPEED